MSPRLLATTALVSLAALGAVSAAAAQDMPGMDHPPPAQSQPQSPPGAAADQGSTGSMQRGSADQGAQAGHGDHDMAGMKGDDMEGMDMSSMTGALGSYPMTREASGTSWQPDVSGHGGIHGMAGSWMTMTHADLNLTYDAQGGPRGDDKTFVSGMVMFSARRDFANLDSFQVRAMLSPDPFMGKSGYPLLLAAGETANGVDPLVDRQHPHDLFMELSGSYTHRFSEHDSAFLYVGLPGEPAFGPPAFMHRQSIMDSPEAPISHHWLDSTHITFGVVTGGWIHDNFKVEVSRFKGREPDQNRYDIESPKLDSTAVRLSWNPNPNWALQVSWADQKSPEQLEPDTNVTRWSASAIYTVPIGDGGWWSTTAAWGRKDPNDGPALDAYVLESAIKPNAAWTVFGRAEHIATDELLAGPGGVHGPVEKVAKVSVGAIHDWRVSDHVQIGLGALYAFNFVPSNLEPSYGGDRQGGMVFLRLKID